MTVTQRELDILRFAAGLRSREITDVLGLSEQTEDNRGRRSRPVPTAGDLGMIAGSG